MDFATIIGLVSGVVLISAAIAADGSLAGFLDVSSIMVTLGGTIAATFVNHSLSDISRVIAMLRIAFTERGYSGRELIDQLVALAEKARREGLLAMEEEAAQIEDGFLRKGIQLIVDGTDPDLVRNVLEIELAFQEDRHRAGQAIFQDMASYAPAFGMLGTLIGLINMLANIDDVDKIAPGMALALVTTFYGVILANLVFLPIAGKLKKRSDEEVLYRHIMLEGILSIQAGENPRLVEEKLMAFLPPQERFRARARTAEEEVGGLRTRTVRTNV